MGPRDSRGPITRSKAPPSTARASARLLVLIVAVIGALMFPGTGAGATACGSAILGDWFDNGHVDLLYDLPCYGEAIDAVPSDLRDYTDAEEVIARALHAATRGTLARGDVDPAPTRVVWNQTGSVDATSPRRSPVDRTATATVDTSGSYSFPIPLLVLGGMSLTLLAAGALGYVSRRRREAEKPSDLDSA